MGFHEFLMVIRKMVMHMKDFSSVFVGRSCEYHGIFHEQSWDLPSGNLT